MPEETHPPASEAITAAPENAPARPHNVFEDANLVTKFLLDNPKVKSRFLLSVELGWGPNNPRILKVVKVLSEKFKFEGFKGDLFFETLRERAAALGREPFPNNEYSPPWAPTISNGHGQPKEKIRPPCATLVRPLTQNESQLRSYFARKAKGIGDLFPYVMSLVLEIEETELHSHLRGLLEAYAIPEAGEAGLARLLDSIYREQKMAPKQALLHSLCPGAYEPAKVENTAPPASSPSTLGMPPKPQLADGDLDRLSRAIENAVGPAELRCRSLSDKLGWAPEKTIYALDIICDKHGVSQKKRGDIIELFSGLRLFLKKQNPNRPRARRGKKETPAAPPADVPAQ